MTELPREMQAWSAAVAFLNEANQTTATKTPRAATHAPYYAMFHAARAVLIKLDGDAAPSKHEAVASRFGFYANQMGDSTLSAAAQSLRDVKKARLTMDYEASVEPNLVTAATAVAQARLFLLTCATVHGFPPP